MKVARKKLQLASESKDPGQPAVEMTTVDPAKELLFARPGFLIRRLQQIHYALFFEECGSENITPVQYGILTAVSVLPGLDQSALGREVGLDRTTTADVVKRLEERGLLERNANPSDKRTRHVTLTTEGRTIVDSLRGRMARAQERLLEPLRPAERTMLMDLMKILVESYSEYSKTMTRSL